MQLCQKEKCTSCGACTVSCPKNAIYFETNEYGFCYPRIDDAKCVDCGLCRKSCHVLNELNGNIPQKAYAVVHHHTAYYLQFSLHTVQESFSLPEPKELQRQSLTIRIRLQL